MHITCQCRIFCLIIHCRSLHQAPDCSSCLRHMCPEGCYAWQGHPGLVRDWGDLLDDKCPHCQSPRIRQTRKGLEPSRPFYLLSAKEAVKVSFRDPEFVDNIHKDKDVSVNSYFRSPDWQRINNGDPVNGTWPPNFLEGEWTILVGCCCDGCRSHYSATQSHTGR